MRLINSMSSPILPTRSLRPPRGQTSTSRLDQGPTLTTAICGSSFETTLLMPKPIPRVSACRIGRTNMAFILADLSLFRDTRTLGSQVTGKDFGPTNHKPRQRQRSQRQWLEGTFLRYSALRWELTTLAVPS